MNMIISAVSQGLLWSILALGLFVSFRILDLADMTTEGSFPLGAAVAVQAITLGANPYIAIIFAIIAGSSAGLITGFLITKLQIPSLLAGILTMTGLYSINLRVMGRANISLLGKDTIFTVFQNMNLPRHFDTITLGLLVVVLIIGLYVIFFKTEFGQAVIATGDNEAMARSLGISTNTMKIVGLMISNGIVALAGSIIAQDNGYADISMGIGTIVIGLASIIIGEVLFTNVSFKMRLVCLMLGSVLYRLIMVMVLEAGMNPNDFKLISAVLLTFFLALPKIKETYYMYSLRKKVKRND
ncbi:putative ABC transport system permease protein [Trichococcus flocculiformis]|uniref:ABC transporter permease n=1 Tax=Trichococcus TaxID=82802 RepID=UPI0007A9268A|nr:MULTISPECIES: branched-chain amino acid ABC transporter permease [Trichococcus]CZQ86591.1 abc transporter permease [Trichococcus sp. ES5]SHF27473.1 putative ABC transport system permease protein [Trichococcus flocculiformis]